MPPQVVISVKKKHKITSTILEDIEVDYQPVFTNVTQLTDKDVCIIKEAFTISKKNNDFKTLTLLRNKVASVLNIESSLYDIDFLNTILKDYNYYTQNMWFLGVGCWVLGVEVYVRVTIHLSLKQKVCESLTLSAVEGSLDNS